MDWDKLRIFHAAAEAGSFTHAGEALRMSQSAVSRQVSSLEKDLGISLFHRHARGLVLTEQGDILYRTASDVLNRLQTAETLLSDSTTKPAGELRITSSVSLGAVWVTQRIREFLDVYPDIRVELILNDEPVDLSMRVADVAITAREPQQSDLIRRPLFSMQVHAFASATYIRKHGAPQTLAELDQHRLVSFMGHPPAHLASINQLENVGREGREARVPAFRASTVLAVKYAIRSGIGVGLIPDYLTEEENDFVPVLRDHEFARLPVYFVYPEELRTAKKVQVFRDFVVAKARQWKY
jgi:DNA-binding transcriptional LysR family regulator